MMLLLAYGANKSSLQGKASFALRISSRFQRASWGLSNYWYHTIDFNKKIWSCSDEPSALLRACFSRSSPPNSPKTTEVVTTNQKDYLNIYTYSLFPFASSL